MIFNPVVVSQDGSLNLFDQIKKEFLENGETVEIGTSALGRTLSAMRDTSIADNEMCGIYMTPNPDYPNMDHDEVILWNQLRAMEGNIGPTGDLSINENGIEWYINDPYVGFAYLIGFDHIQLQ